MVGLTALYPGEEWEIYQAVLELETFVLTVRRQLLPVLKERLGISWLFPGRRVRDRNQVHAAEARGHHLPVQPRTAARRAPSGSRTDCSPTIPAFPRSDTLGR